MNKLSSTQIAAANEALSRLDTLAATIQKRYASWGMSATEAKAAVNSLDSVADTLEKLAFGEESLQARQVEVLKQAKVIQQDSDEGYMKTFNSPTGPKQTDGDEPFMQAYADDDTAGVSAGKSTTGRPLAP